ncbi:hypothetical protein VHEMI02603 [[Torrubiella] hemipterigena]|uniref:RRM domain-containing protein n=1 Tax=[Torrubiella] hemipterigena TaxID=1531966 RepID=A0A0A1TAZ0_9HYPO|nr:hypothetical protein VHEMI02603 [[Torrubiella] hemipterigena]
MTKDETKADSPQVKDNTKSVKRKADLEEIEVDVSAPEPPSKRAKRALKKGKSLTKAATSDDEKDDEESGKPGKVRSEHSVWIGNLPFTLTAKELRQWLVDNSGGVITDEAITRIKLPTVKVPGGRPKDEKPANKGFAYVDFTDIGGKVAAIALSETELNARRLLIKDAKSFEGRPAKEKEEGEGEDKAGKKVNGKPDADAVDPNASRKVFVGNLSFKVTEDDVWQNFEKCGEIESVKLATFEDTGKCKGFGWVKFKTAQGAAWAVKGFVKIKEAVETEADFQDDADEEKKQEQKQFKTRKWWVNRLMGRELKLELAEDDQSRYRKRFGKDRPKDGEARPPRDRGNFNRREGNNRAPVSEVRPSKDTDINVARLTGQVVEHTGTKTSFD